MSANEQPDRFKKTVSKLSVAKPSSNLRSANTFNQPKSNPFASNPGGMPKSFGNQNPFAKQRLDKENVLHNGPRSSIYRQQATFSEVPRKVLHAIPINTNQSLVMNRPHEEAIPLKKTKKQLIAEVMDYFLHSEIIDEIGANQKSVELRDLKENEVQYLIIKPLQEAFMADIPINDSFKDLYQSNSMHDVELYFDKNDSVIKAHKVVLMTSNWLKDQLQNAIISAENSSFNNSKYYTKDGKLILKFCEFDSVIFGKVLKIMYTSKLKDSDYNANEARAMYRLACKIDSKIVQRYLIVHKLLPNLSLDH